MGEALASSSELDSRNSSTPLAKGLKDPSKVIARRHSSAFERWKLPLVSGSTGDDCTPTHSVATAQKSHDEVHDQIAGQAYAEGRAAGYEQGYEQGYAQGREQGSAASDAEQQVLVARLEGIMKSLSEPLADLDEAVEEALVTLAIAIARQLIRRELRTNPGEVVAVVREAMAALPLASRNVQLYLHPDDATLVRKAMALESDTSLWTIVEDPVLTRGGCRVESDPSRIDASVESRLASVIAQVFGGERDGDQQAGE